MTQNNLAIAMMTLGMREDSMLRLQEPRAAIQGSLEIDPDH